MDAAAGAAAKDAAAVELWSTSLLPRTHRQAFRFTFSLSGTSSVNTNLDNVSTRNAVRYVTNRRQRTLHSPDIHMSLCVELANIAFPRHSHFPLCTISKHCIPHTLTCPSVYIQRKLRSLDTHMSLFVQSADIAFPIHSHVPQCTISTHCNPHTLTCPSVYNLLIRNEFACTIYIIYLYFSTAL